MSAIKRQICKRTDGGYDLIETGPQIRIGNAVRLDHPSELARINQIRMQGLQLGDESSPVSEACMRITVAPATGTTYPSMTYQIKKASTIDRLTSVYCTMFNIDKDTVQLCSAATLAPLDTSSTCEHAGLSVVVRDRVVAN